MHLAYQLIQMIRSFDTLLENEYALMALALEEKKDKNNNKIYDIEDIYEWIDYVRR